MDNTEIRSEIKAREELQGYKARYGAFPFLPRTNLERPRLSVAKIFPLSLSLWLFLTLSISMEAKSAVGVSFGTRAFSTEEQEHVGDLLERRLAGEHLAQRVGSGNTKFTYVESWKAIELANSVFGFNGWCVASSFLLWLPWSR